MSPVDILSKVILHFLLESSCITSVALSCELSFATKVTCGKKSETLTVSAQNSFGQMDYKIGEQVKLNVDDKSLVGFLD